MNSPFVFIIAYNCGIIANKCLETYHKYHNLPVHIFCNSSDLDQIPAHPNNIIIDLSSDNDLSEFYKQGHRGTAYIWAKVISKHYGDYNEIIQIDSDIIFVKECLSDITSKFEEGYDLVGARRAYRSMANVPVHLSSQIKDLNDTVCTFFVGAKLDKISNYDFNTIHKMAGGHFNPLGHSIIDFFDPVSFDIMNNGGKVHYLDFENYGSCDTSGSFDNGHLRLNELFDCGNKILHIAGVGSGKRFMEYDDGTISRSYVDWAKDRFCLYMNTFHGKNLSHNFSSEDYSILLDYLHEQH